MQTVDVPFILLQFVLYKSHGKTSGQLYLYLLLFSSVNLTNR